MKFISKSLWMELGYANVVKNALSCWSGGRVKKTVEAYGISFRHVYFGLYLMKGSGDSLKEKLNHYIGLKINARPFLAFWCNKENIK